MPSLIIKRIVNGQYSFDNVFYVNLYTFSNANFCVYGVLGTTNKDVSFSR